MQNNVNRRNFLRGSAAIAGAIALSRYGNFVAAAEDKDVIKKTRSYNPDMQYRRLGSTGLWVSAICLGGHFKRVNEVTGKKVNSYGRSKDPECNKALDQNRDTILGRCMDVGINLVDACTEGEVATYGPLLQGNRREKMYLNCASWPKCPRDAKWRSKKKLMEVLEMSLKNGKQDYFDIWRLVTDDRGRHTDAENAEFVAAIEQAKKDGKVRFGGVSSHSHKWLTKMATTYPKTFQVMIFPYTVKTKELPKSSLFEAVRKHDIGTLGIKPFGSNSLFHGASDNKEKDRRARMTLQYILGNPAITAPIPGLATIHEVDNAAAAVKGLGKLNNSEKKEIAAITDDMYANLPPKYEWLRDWEYV